MTEEVKATKRGLRLSPASESFLLWPYLLIGLIVRYALIPLQGGFSQDRTVIQGWAQTMSQVSLDRFYSSAPNPDHLPGDLLALKAVQLVYSALGFDTYDDTFDWFARSLGIGSDLIVALLLFSILAKLGMGKEGRIAALLYLFIPIAPVMSGYWTAYDSVSLALLLAVARLSLEKSFAAACGIGLFSSWALLVKPQLVIPLIPFVLVYFWGPGLVLRVKEILAFVMTGLLWALVVCGIFGLGLWWDMSQGSLLDRYSYAAELWPYSTNAAANVWAWASVDAVDSDLLFGVSHLAWGVGLSLLAMGTVLIGAWVKRKDWPRFTIALWISTGLYFSLFLFATRMHGRYILPAFALLLILAYVVKRKTLWASVSLISLAFAASFFYGINHDFDYTVLRPSALLVMIGFGLFLSVPWTADIEKSKHEEVTP